MKRTIIAAIALAALTSNAFATNLGRCQSAGTRTEVTPGADITEQRDIIELQKQYANYTGTDAGGSNYSSLLAVCDPDSTHPWHATMVKNGACLKNGAELRSMTSHTGGSVVVAIKPVKVGEETVVVGQEPDVVTEIDQYQTGTLDVKDTAKESAKAYAEAVKAEIAAAKAEHRWPSLPDPRDHIVEVVDWNPAQDGSC